MNLATNAAFAMRETGGTLDIELSDFSVSPTSGNPHGIDPGLYMRLDGPRHGRRHTAGNHRQDIRPLLHDEEDRRGDRPRPLGSARHRQAGPRLHHR